MDMFPILFVLLSLCLQCHSRNVCPYDEKRYASKRFVLAIEDYPFGVLTGDIFEGLNSALPKLKSLILRNDSVHTVFPDTFLHLRKLKCLDLSSNKLKQFSESMFRGLRDLDTLILRNNRVSKLEDSTFISVGHMKTLDLSNNGISSVGDAAFRGLIMLEELNLENNDISSLPNLLFYHTPNLKTLRLNNNPITILDLSMLPQLIFLDASKTRLADVPVLPESMEKLNLKKSQISSFQIGKEHFPHMKEVLVEGNPIECSCELVEIVGKTWKQATMVQDFDKITCKNAEEELLLTVLDQLIQYLNCTQLNIFPDINTDAYSTLDTTTPTEHQPPVIISIPTLPTTTTTQVIVTLPQTSTTVTASACCSSSSTGTATTATTTTTETETTTAVTETAMITLPQHPTTEGNTKLDGLVIDRYTDDTAGNDQTPTPHIVTTAIAEVNLVKLEEILKKMQRHREKHLPQISMPPSTNFGMKLAPDPETAVDVVHDDGRKSEMTKEIPLVPSVDVNITTATTVKNGGTTIKETVEEGQNKGALNRTTLDTCKGCVEVGVGEEEEVGDEGGGVGVGVGVGEEEEVGDEGGGVGVGVGVGEEEEVGDEGGGVGVGEEEEVGDEGGGVGVGVGVGEEEEVGDEGGGVFFFNAVTILISLAFGLALCLIFIVVFMVLQKIRRNRSKRYDTELPRGTNPIRLYGGPVFTVSPMRDDVIMRSTYGRSEGMRALEASDYVDYHASLHHQRPPFPLDGSEFQGSLSRTPRSMPTHTSTATSSPPSSSSERPLWRPVLPGVERGELMEPHPYQYLGVEEGGGGGAGRRGRGSLEEGRGGSGLIEVEEPGRDAEQEWTKN